MVNSAQHWHRADRRYFIGGSDARIIMGDDEPALLRLWREKRGKSEPEDLSGNLIVQLGTATEPLNRLWYERNTGNTITDVQRRVMHPVLKWMAATLDGVVQTTGAVFEAKFMLPWYFSEETAAGEFPIEAVETMIRIALETEEFFPPRVRRSQHVDSDSHAISHAACSITESIDVRRAGGRIERRTEFVPNSRYFIGAIFAMVRR